MDSFVLAETFKYLFLLYAEKSDLVLDVDDYIFTTEAHLLPLSLSLCNSTRGPPQVSKLYILRKLPDQDGFTASCFENCETNHHFQITQPYSSLLYYTTVKTA